MRAPLLVLYVLGVSVLGASDTAAQPSTDSLQMVVEAAWLAVAETYYDTTFHGVNWDEVRAEFVRRSYSDREEAYAAIRGMIGRLGNPATRFLTPPQARALLAELSGRPHEGVGLVELLSVDTDEQTQEVVVVTPVPGGPAARAGLRPGDVIVAVAGEAVAPLELAETMSRLRGRAGTSVSLTIRRGEQMLTGSLERRALPALTAVEGVVDQGPHYAVGYIGLRQFTAEAPAEVRRLIEHSETEGVTGYVLDLRNNPGGSLQAAQEIAALFLGEQVIARLRDRSQGPTPLRSQGAQVTSKPLVALVNAGSASAAEMLAGAFQHHERGTVMGQLTFGKGLVHGFSPLPDGSAVMPTVGRLATPGGRDILDEGIAPDILLRNPTDTEWEQAIARFFSAMKP